jgi:GGDEF domain-containing protein
MSGVASTLQGQGTDGRHALVGGLTPELLRRRVGQRRQILAVQVASYSLGALVLLVYAYSGTVPIIIPSSYFLCGLTLTGFFIVLSETHFNDRFEDHYLTIFQICGNVALQLGYLLWAPEIGYAFLTVLFLIFGFGALRMTSRQAIIAWTLTTLGLAPIFLLTDLRIGMPVALYTERVAAMLGFIITIGQCAFVGLYGSSMRKTLYERGVELKAANKRIEELAELDELTGSFNRRCIMRMLDDEIARARRLKTSCAIALIDLDWFKRVNDHYGHPIDRFGRYGGEEFLLVLPDTPDDEAVRTLNRLRAIIADLDWSAFSPDMQVTISAGVATLKPDETPETFLARADSALYIAKARGRNRIVSV